MAQYSLDGRPDDANAIAFFDGMRRQLEDFAERHDLTIQRYPQNQPIWLFMFLHPKGGRGALQLTCATPLCAATEPKPWLSAHWHKDDDGNGIRRAYPSSPPREIEGLAAKAVVDALELKLGEVRGWDSQALTVTSPLSSRRGNAAGQARLGEIERLLRHPK